MEYMCEKTENKRILIATDLHYCDKLWHNAGRKERMENFCRCINEEYSENPYDAILLLGDYSLDFWCWDTCGTYLNENPVSDTANYMKDVYPNFPLPAYMIPGNHEQYGNEKWKKITGFERQFSVVYGEYVFLMLDTFGGDLDPTEHSDGTYTGIDAEFLSTALDKHPDKKIVICAHDIIPEKEGEAAKKLIRENDRIICAFTGHTHRSNTVILDKSWRNLPVLYCGDFSYSAGRRPENPNWGYRIVDLENGFSTEYKRARI